MRPSQRQFLSDVINGFDLRQLCGFRHISIYRCPWESAAPNARLQAATVALHRERPVAPDWPTEFDAIGDVEKRVNGQRTHTHPINVVLQIKAGIECERCIQKRGGIMPYCS